MHASRCHRSCIVIERLPSAGRPPVSRHACGNTSGVHIALRRAHLTSNDVVHMAANRCHRSREVRSKFSHFLAAVHYMAPLPLSLSNTIGAAFIGMRGPS